MKDRSLPDAVFFVFKTRNMAINKRKFFAFCKRIEGVLRSEINAEFNPTGDEEINKEINNIIRCNTLGARKNKKLRAVLWMNLNRDNREIMNPRYVHIDLHKKNMIFVYKHRYIEILRISYFHDFAEFDDPHMRISGSPEEQSKKYNDNHEHMNWYKKSLGNMGVSEADLLKIHIFVLEEVMDYLVRCKLKYSGNSLLIAGSIDTDEYLDALDRFRTSEYKRIQSKLEKVSELTTNFKNSIT